MELKIEESKEYIIDINEKSNTIIIPNNIEAIIRLNSIIDDYELIININSNNNIKVVENLNVIHEKNILINTNITGNNNHIEILGSYVINNNLTIISNGSIKENTIDNEFLEHYDCLMINGKAKVLPNLLVSSKEIIANHGVTISPINKELLFYIMSKGINKETSINLIKNSYLNKY